MNWTAIAAALKALIEAFKPLPITPTPMPSQPAPQKPPTPPKQPPVAPQPIIKPKPSPMSKYLWDNMFDIRHSIRVICDEEGLTLEQKNTMCATIHAESGFLLHARHYNYDPNGKLLNVDHGLCQWNSYFHGKEITPDQAENNPEMAVRLMCAYWKRNQRNLWIAYKNKSYLQYMV